MTNKNQGCGKEFPFNSYTWICGKSMKGANLKDTFPLLCPKCKEQQNQSQDKPQEAIGAYRKRLADSGQGGSAESYSCSDSWKDSTPQGLEVLKKILEKANSKATIGYDCFEHRDYIELADVEELVKEAISLTLAHCEEAGKFNWLNGYSKAKEEAEDKFEKIKKELGKIGWSMQNDYDNDQKVIKIIDKIKEGKE